MSSQLESVDLLQKTVAETSGTTLTISPKENGWSGYLVQQKRKFEGSNLPELAQTMNDHICANRVKNQGEPKGKKNVKPYKYSKVDGVTKNS